MTTAPEKTDRAAWLNANGAHCSVLPLRARQTYRFIILGAPGMGKTTQARLLNESLGACLLSTEEMFRAARCTPPPARSSAMDLAMDCIRRDASVPDEVMFLLLSERFRCLSCHGGFILDGYPRNIAQAMELETLMQREQMILPLAINYETSIEDIIERIAGRRTCAGCKARYHTSTNPPGVEDVCDHCGGELMQNVEDRPVAVRARMDTHLKTIAQLKDFYGHRQRLLTITAHGTPDEIYDQTLEALMTRNARKR